MSDPALREKILQLRNDPQVSAVMAGKFPQANQSYRTAQLGRTPTSGE